MLVKVVFGLIVVYYVVKSAVKSGIREYFEEKASSEETEVIEAGEYEA